MSDLQTARDGVRVTFTLDRPKLRNALSASLAAELASAIKDAERDRAVRCIVIAGAGDTFCAGMDLKERRTLDAEQKWTQSQSLRDLTAAVIASPKPVIAAIDGFCLGGGFELALACDLRVACEEAMFGFPEMTLGAYPGGGGAVLLPRLAGVAAAKKLMFATDRLPAAEAYRMGLVDWLVPRGQLSATLDGIADSIRRRSPRAIAALKQVLDGGKDLSYRDATALDAEMRRPLEGTKDYQEGIEAFFARRPAVFTGE